MQQEIIHFIEQELVAETIVSPLTASDDLLMSELLDSLNVMRLVLHLEDTYGKPIPPADITIDNFRTVADMVSYLQRQDG